jgi:hypothetical protein
VCYELSPETERKSIVSLEDAVLFAHDLGYNNIDVNKSSVTVAELMYFLAIELQSRRLALRSDPSSATISRMGTEEKIQQYTLETLQCPKDQEFLECLKKSFRMNFEHRAKVMAARLKVTAQSFLEFEMADQPFTEAQAQLNKLIISIQRDEDSLLPIHSLMDHDSLKPTTDTLKDACHVRKDGKNTNHIVSISSIQNSALDRLHSVIIDAFRDLGIRVNPNLFSCLPHSNDADKDSIDLLQRLCAELSTQKEGPLISSVQDAITFAKHLGYDFLEDDKTEVATADLIYFLLIELQSRHLSLQSNFDLKSSSWEKDKSLVQDSIAEHIIKAEDPKMDEVSILHLKDQKFLECMEEKLIINFQNQAKLIAARLKVTAQSFQETETDPENKLNNLISKILKDSDSLLQII